MWDTLKALINSENVLSILCCVLIAIVIFAVIAKTGLLKINTKHVRIGNDDERDIIRQQSEYAHTYIMGLTYFVTSDRDPYFTKYILERMYDEVITWIVFNHFSLDNAYIMVKTNSLHALLCSLDDKPEVKEDKFKQQMHDWIYDLVKNLIEIREVHK